jgi:hypothetical protein
MDIKHIDINPLLECIHVMYQYQLCKAIWGSSPDLSCAAADEKFFRSI